MRDVAPPAAPEADARSRQRTANPYPDLIPTVPRKPLRIFMAVNHRDLHRNQPEMNWLSNNLRVAAALAESGYDFRLVLGDGRHSGNHDGVLFPDALRWALRDRVQDWPPEDGD